VPGVRIARKHLGWYSKGLPGSAEFRAAVNQTDEVARVESLLRAFYEPLIEQSGELRLVRGDDEEAPARHLPRQSREGRAAALAIS
jgi:tRNA-dihydrouridine synthase B